MASTKTNSSSSPSITIVITKPSKKSKLGLGIDFAFGRGGRLKVKSIDPHGPFARTALKVGMQIDTINGRMYSTYNEGEALLKEATGRVTIVASGREENVKRDIIGDTIDVLADGHRRRNQVFGFRHIYF